MTKENEDDNQNENENGNETLSSPLRGNPELKIKLSKILSRHCPREIENNRRLLNVCSGKEAATLKHIEFLIEETPFDELQLAIFSYVNSTLESSSKQSSDEGPYLSPPRSAYKVRRSISISSRAMSHITDTTQNANNTAKYLLKKYPLTNTKFSKRESDKKVTYEINDGDASTIKPRHNQAVDSKLKMQAYLQGKREKDRILADSQSDPLSKLLDDSDEEKKNVQASQTIKVQQAQHTFTSSPNKAQQTAFVPELPNITSGNENDYGGDRDDEDTDSHDFDNMSALSDPFLTKKEKEKEILKNAAYLKVVSQICIYCVRFLYLKSSHFCICVNSF